MNPEDVPQGPLCVDTDVFRYLHVGKRPHLDEFQQLVRSHVLVLSFATVGEVRAWSLHHKFGDRRRQELEQKILDHYVVLTPTDAVVRAYAQLHARFTGRLSQGGQNDMWTAACALAQPSPLPVVTNNLGDFTTIAEESPSKSYTRHGDSATHTCCHLLGVLCW